MAAEKNLCKMSLPLQTSKGRDDVLILQHTVSQQVAIYHVATGAKYCFFKLFVY